MIDNPLGEVIDRLRRMAEMHGTVYCRIEWEAETETFLFTPLLSQFVTVSFERKEA